MIRKTIALLSAGLVLAVLAGCTQNASESSGPTSGGGTAAAAGDDAVTGRVTAFDGSTITLDLVSLALPDGGQKPDSGGFSQGAPAMGEAPAMPSGAPDGRQQPEQGQDADAPTGALPSEGGPGGGQLQGGVTSSGETRTVTVTSATTVTISGRDSQTAGALSDIAVGDIVSVALSGDSATAITVIKSGASAVGGDNAGNQNGAPASDEAA